MVVVVANMMMFKSEQTTCLSMIQLDDTARSIVDIHKASYKLV